MHGSDYRRSSDFWWLWIFRGVPCGEADEGCKSSTDLRGKQPDTTHDHRPRDAKRLVVQIFPKCFEVQSIAARGVEFGEIDIPFWAEAGFRLAECEVNGLRFWTRDPSRTTSGDTHQDPYTFIGTPIILSLIHI